MATKIAVLNPTNAQYSFAEDRASAVQLIAKTALDFYIEHAHGELCSVVTVNEDGSETWTNERGEQRLSPQEIEAELMRQLQAQAVFNRAYGELPVTEVGGGTNA